MAEPSGLAGDRAVQQAADQAAGQPAGPAIGHGSRRPADRTAAWLGRIWAALDGDPGLIDRVRITGPAGLLPAVYDVDALATASVAAATLAVAELGARRLWTGVPEVGIDRFAAAAAFRSERLIRPLGWQLPPIWDPIAGDYLAADGWIRLHTNYAGHRAAALQALGLRPGDDVDREQVADRVRRFAAPELEQAVVAAGGCAAVLYRAEEWASHPHGTVAGGEAAIRLERRSAQIDRSTPKPGVGREPGAGWEPSGGGPLAGIRVLDLTRVIAGPVCTRTLAAWGAEVLRIDPPGFAEVPALLPETTAGKHCAAIDLRDDEGRARFVALVAEADVIVHGLRPGALSGLGFGDRALRRINPGLCIAAVDAYGWSGPWAARRGFDSLVQFSCGIAAAGGAAVARRATGDALGPAADDDPRPGNALERPVPLPAQALDHATGYLLAAAVCRGLTGRYDELAPADVHGALVGTANLLMEQPTSLAGGAPAGPDPESATVVRNTAWGPVAAVPQPGTIGGAGGDWRVLAGPLGRDEPIFTV
jgi:hypothetical protein